MNTFCKYAALITLPCLILGCPPDKRVVWSPDGSRAAICADQSLHFIDADGNVLAPRLDARATQCVWLSNDRHILVVRVDPANSWDEVSGVLSAEQIRVIEELAATLKQRAMAFEGDWEKFDIGFEDEYSPATTAAVLLYLRDKLSDGLQTKLADKWDDLEKMQLDVNVLQSYEITNDTLVPGVVLIRSLDGIGGVTLSKCRRKIAFVSQNAAEHNNRLTLFTVNSTGGTPSAIASNVGASCAWSPDGSELAYFKCMTGNSSDTNNLQLGAMTLATVADGQGRLLAQPSGEQEEIGVLFNGLWSIHWLSDGRLLFSSVEVTLPATNADMPQRWGLFIFDPHMPSTVTRVFARSFNQPLEESFPHFELSPDERHVLMLGSQGEIVDYDLRNGASKILSTDPCTGKGGSPTMVPVWRADGEACFDICVEGGDGGDQKRQVVLWKDGKTRTLSADWPEEMTADWLYKRRSISTQGSEEE